MKFKDFLDSCDEFDGELFHSELMESQYSFCWDGETHITAKGLEQFKNLLGSEVKIHNNTIELLSENIPQEEYDLWMSAVAGYVSTSKYNRWFSDGFGICEFCKDDYDNPRETPLYKLGGHLRCGDCANEYTMSAEEHELAYGRD